MTNTTTTNQVEAAITALKNHEVLYGILQDAPQTIKKAISAYNKASLQHPRHEVRYRVSRDNAWDALIEYKAEIAK